MKYAVSFFVTENISIMYLFTIRNLEGIYFIRPPRFGSKIRRTSEPKRYELHGNGNFDWAVMCDSMARIVVSAKSCIQRDQPTPEAFFRC